MAFTFFFRDEQTLTTAIDRALPSLRGRAFIHVWDAGCAYGPEPYTLAILLRERMSEFVFRNVRIHATDLEPSFAVRVNSGVFSDAEVKRTPPGILRKYFHPAAPGFVAAAPQLQTRITFSVHDLLTLRPPRNDFSLIVCKNVLLHFEEPQRIEVLRMFHAALQPRGLLVMEHTQKLPAVLARFFRQLTPCAQVYQKLEPAFVEHPAESIAPDDRFHQHTETPVGKSLVCCTRPDYSRRFADNERTADT